MKRRALVAALVFALAALSLSAQATVSQKQDVAIFALGYYGWAIPQEALGNIDVEIQKVFVDLGRFNIIGMTERLSSGGLDQFIATLKKAKEANFVMPDKYQFGEAVLTEAEFNKLLGAFIVAVPVVTNFNSFYNYKSFQYETQLKTNVTFIDVATGNTIGISEVETTGTNKDNQAASIASAIDSIPMQLQFEIRKIPAFQISTRILEVRGAEVKLQLGQDMGIQKGDEYAVIKQSTIMGVQDQREVGLIDIKDVGTGISTGQIIYSNIPLGPNVQLREIPRLGVDAEPYLHVITGAQSAVLPGVRMVVSRGFYGFRPYVGVQIPVAQIWNFGTIFAVPVSAILGGEFNMHLGRLTVTPYGGVGITYLYVSEAITGYNSQTSFLSHVGFQGYVNLSYLITRDVSIYAEGGVDYWLKTTPYFDSYGGPGFGGGLSIKL
ncbi:MAG: hypothetical protein M0Z80_07110 [Treponema sp.]|nr:hypothetical protein [Treponema sp.]